jgi:hypothetical protein
VVGNGQATVTVVAPSTGGTPASYTVTASPNGATCTVSGASGSCTVTGLTNGQSYTFTSTATNSGGTSSASSASTAVTPAAPVVAPGTPGTPTAVAGNGQATVTVVAPSTGGTPVSYTVTASPNGATCTVSGASGSCTVSGLTNGQSYTFSSTATNSGGTSSTSTASTAVAPVAPVVVVPPAPPITPPSTSTLSPPTLLGIAGQPLSLNFGQGSGPELATCLVNAVNQVLGGGARFLGQADDGSSRVAISGQVISFYPLDVNTDTRQEIGIFLRSTNPLNVSTSCGMFNTGPAVYSLRELAGVLSSMGLTATINEQGVITLVVNAATWVVRPSYFVTPGMPGGRASLELGADGLWRLIDTQGNTQSFYPAFLNPDMLSSQVALAVGGNTVIQADGTAIVTLMNAERYLLVPDWTLGDVPLEHLFEGWWQDGPDHYRYRNTSMPNASQGFSVKRLP